MLLCSMGFEVCIKVASSAPSSDLDGLLLEGLRGTLGGESGSPGDCRIQEGALPRGSWTTGLRVSVSQSEIGFSAPCCRPALNTRLQLVLGGTDNSMSSRVNCWVAMRDFLCLLVSPLPMQPAQIFGMRVSWLIDSVACDVLFACSSTSPHL